MSAGRDRWPAPPDSPAAARSAPRSAPRRPQRLRPGQAQPRRWKPSTGPADACSVPVLSTRIWPFPLLSAPRRVVRERAPKAVAKAANIGRLYPSVKRFLVGRYGGPGIGSLSCRPWHSGHDRANDGRESAVEYQVNRKLVTIWSEGSRLAAVLLTPAATPAPRPAILLCHGWGGLKEHLISSYATPFAEAGFGCLAFDYRGWGESDGRLICAPDTS